MISIAVCLLQEQKNIEQGYDTPGWSSLYFDNI